MLVYLYVRTAYTYVECASAFAFGIHLHTRSYRALTARIEREIENERNAIERNTKPSAHKIMHINIPKHAI